LATSKECKKPPSPRRKRSELKNALLRQLERSPVTFLYLYGKILTERSTEFLREIIKNPKNCRGLGKIDITRMRMWIEGKEVELEAVARKHRLRVKNRRYKKMVELEKDGYFEDSSIQRRAPDLYNELIARFASRAKSKGDMKIPSRGIQNKPKQHQVSTPTKRLSDLLLDRCYEKRGFPCGVGEAKATGNLTSAEAAARDVEIGQWYAGGVDAKEASEGDRRAAMISMMKDRFMQGHEAEIDYEKIDKDERLDDIAELARAAEEKWFDED